MAEQQAPEHRHYDPLTSEGPRRKKGLGAFGIATIVVVGVHGLLFAYLAQVSLLRQGYNGHLTRGHWPAQMMAALCYVFSALAFCAACWLAAGQAASDMPQTAAYAKR
jgi:hypothetical protein